MSKNLNDEYMKMIETEEIPDLWNRISAEISKETADAEKIIDINQKKGKKNFYRMVSAAAACIMLVLVLPTTMRLMDQESGMDSQSKNASMDTAYEAMENNYAEEVYEAAENNYAEEVYEAAENNYAEEVCTEESLELIPCTVKIISSERKDNHVVYEAIVESCSAENLRKGETLALIDDFQEERLGFAVGASVKVTLQPDKDTASDTANGPKEKYLIVN